MTRCGCGATPELVRMGSVYLGHSEYADDLWSAITRDAMGPRPLLGDFASFDGIGLLPALVVCGWRIESFGYIEGYHVSALVCCPDQRKRIIDELVSTARLYWAEVAP